MSDVVEVRPDALASADLEAFTRALHAGPSETEETPRLVGPDGASIELPASIHALLVSVVNILSSGDGVSIIPLHAELTTVQAADILNVSRPHLIKQIEAGEIAFHMVGTHRRLRLVDVLAYRDRLDLQADEALDAMVVEAEDLGLYESQTATPFLAGYVVVLDANVLYGVEVTDLFATMATRRLFRPHWSPQILDEVTRNLARRPDLDPAAIERRLGHLGRALPGALAEVPPPLIDAMPVNENDRHVLALAIHVGAPTIVTNNLRDFPTALLEPFGVEAISADEFALAQVDLHVDGVLASIDDMAARRRRHPKTRADIIETLRKQVPVAMGGLLAVMQTPS